VFEDRNKEYVVPHISFDSFVITDFNDLYSLELKRFDSKIRFESKRPIRRFLLLELKNSSHEYRLKACNMSTLYIIDAFHVI